MKNLALIGEGALKLESLANIAVLAVLGGFSPDMGNSIIPIKLKFGKKAYIRRHI